MCALREVCVGCALKFAVCKICLSVKRAWSMHKCVMWSNVQGVWSMYMWDNMVECQGEQCTKGTML